MNRAVIIVKHGSYRWEATRQADDRVWLVREYGNVGLLTEGLINTYACHDENIAGQVRKTIGTAEV